MFMGSKDTIDGEVFTAFFDEINSKRYATICGPNNNGKSFMLKSFRAKFGKPAYLMGVNRFYHVLHFGVYVRDALELDNYENQFWNSVNDPNHNSEQNFMDLVRVISNLSNAKRTLLFELASELLETKLTFKMVDEDNELSPRYIDMDGQNVSLGSTGTRLLLTILGTCFDDRFSTLLIDEPELGFAPKLQLTISKFFQDEARRLELFPHLERIIVATHSHLFLSRNVSSNYYVRKMNGGFEVNALGSIQDLHNLQFNLLGNNLDALYFPSAIIIVEGKTDFEYIRKIIETEFAGRRVTLISANGDPKTRVHSLRDTLGDFQQSPLRPRTFVVLDSVHQAGLVRQLAEMGIPEENIAVWKENGIEYLYPSSVMAKIFACGEQDIGAMKIEGDVIRINGIAKKKADLCSEICRLYRSTDPLPDELVQKLIDPIRRAIS